MYLLAFSQISKLSCDTCPQECLLKFQCAALFGFVQFGGQSNPVCVPVGLSFHYQPKATDPLLNLSEKDRNKSDTHAFQK